LSGAFLPGAPANICCGLQPPVDNGPTVIPLACAHDRSAEQLVQAAQRFTQILRDRGRFLPSPAARLAQFRKGARGIV